MRRPMEFMLLLWDEVDDLAWACRHVAGAAMSEVIALGAPLAAAGSALAVWASMAQVWVNAALLGALAVWR